MMRARGHRAAVAALITLITTANIATCTGVKSLKPSYLNALSLERNAQVHSKVGECGVVFPETFEVPKEAGETKSHICIHIQKYGFLTRYIRWEFPGKAGLGEISDTCLLVAYCGERCRQTRQRRTPVPGAQNSEPKSRDIQVASHSRSRFWPLKAVTENAESQQTGAFREGGSTMPSRELPKSNRIQNNAQETLTHEVLQQAISDAVPESGRLDTTYSKYSSALLASDATTRSFAMLESLNCKRHLRDTCSISAPRSKGVSRVYRNDVYKLRIAAAHDGMMKFWGRLAAFIGAANITEVAAFEEDTAVYSQMLRNVAISRLAKKAGSMRPDMAIRAVMLRSSKLLEGEITKSHLRWGQMDRNSASFDERGPSLQLMAPRSQQDHASARETYEETKVSPANSFISVELEDADEPKIQISLPLEIVASLFKQNLELPQPMARGNSRTSRKLRAAAYAPMGGESNPSYAVSLTTAAQCAAAAAIIRRIPHLEELSQYIFFRSR